MAVPTGERAAWPTDMTDQSTVLRAERFVDVDAGEVRSPAVVVVEGERIAAVNPATVPMPRPRSISVT